MSTELRTCAASLLYAGTCCWEGCSATAVISVLDDDLVEHARCLDHDADAIEAKPLRWAPSWGPS
jgi:hypothetical protein